MSYIENGIANNADGWGFVAVTPEGEVTVERGWAVRRAKSVWREHKGLTRIFHARLGNVGDVNNENLHPFNATYVSQDGKDVEERWLFHNGTLHGLPRFVPGMCDSWHLAANVSFFPTNEDLITGLDKLAIREASRFILVAGKMIYRIGTGWKEQDGVWYSNETCFPDVYREKTATGNRIVSKGGKVPGTAYPFPSGQHANGSNTGSKAGTTQGHGSTSIFAEDTLWDNHTKSWISFSSLPAGSAYKVMWKGDQKPAIVRWNPGTRANSPWEDVGGVWWMSDDPRIEAAKASYQIYIVQLRDFVGKGDIPKDQDHVNRLVKNSRVIVQLMKNVIATVTNDKMAGDVSAVKARTFVFHFRRLLTEVPTYLMTDEECKTMADFVATELGRVVSEKIVASTKAD